VRWHSVFAAAVLAVPWSAAEAQSVSEFESGRVQYQRTCAQCHGRNMVNSGVTVYDLRKFPADQEERFFGAVLGGKANMPAFAGALSPEQVRSLWTYVRNRGEEPAALKICVADGNAPLSHRVNGEPRGLDVALSRAIAGAMGRPLQLVFFESEYDRDRTLAQEVNAMLSSGVCELASGFALFASDLGAPARASARTPDYEGAKPRRLRPFVALRALAATRAYYAMAMGVVTRDPALAVDSLAALQNLKVGAITGTLAGSALMLYRNGVLQGAIVTLSQRENVLQALEAGRFDATLTPLGAYDAYRLAHPGTRIFRAQFVHPLRINLGFVGLEGEPALAAGSRLIERALASGELARWAEAEGASWIAPQPPDIQPPFGLGSLRID
jgi:ABC-type amino acid transport substrate-binding protein